MLPLVLALLQAQPAAVPERFSILAQPCAPVTRDGKEVVVCGNDPAASQRLPLPQEAVPDHPIPSNPFITGGGALAAANKPCAVRLEGCQVGFGPPIGAMIGAAATGVGNALKDRREARARKRDGTRRVPIALDGDGPKGRVEP